MKSQRWNTSTVTVGLRRNLIICICFLVKVPHSVSWGEHTKRERTLALKLSETLNPVVGSQVDEQSSVSTLRQKHVAQCALTLPAVKSVSRSRVREPHGDRAAWRRAKSWRRWRSSATSHFKIYYPSIFSTRFLLLSARACHCCHCNQVTSSSQGHIETYNHSHLGTILSLQLTFWTMGRSRRKH